MPQRKSNRSTAAPAAPPMSEGATELARRMTIRVATEPRPFDTVLTSLADLLIDNAERDGTIKLPTN